MDVGKRNLAFHLLFSLLTLHLIYTYIEMFGGTDIELVQFILRRGIEQHFHENSYSYHIL